ncbi:MAG: hypothetical protein ACFFCW_47400 [Candidatus Hodarchaeota archaeon]
MYVSHSIGVIINEIRLKNPSIFHRILYRRAGKPAFLVGKRYEIEFCLTNVSHTKPFTGGELVLSVQWTSKRTDWHRVVIPILKPKETTEPFVKEYGVVEVGYGLVMAQGKAYDSPAEFKKPIWERKKMGDLDIFVNDENLGIAGAHVESVFGQTAEEFYQFWAMMLAAIGLCYILVKDIVVFLFNLIMTTGTANVG